VSTQDFFDFIKASRRFWPASPRLRASPVGWRFPIKVNGEVVGAIGLSGAPTVQNDVGLREGSLALVPEHDDAMVSHLRSAPSISAAVAFRISSERGIVDGAAA